MKIISRKTLVIIMAFFLVNCASHRKGIQENTEIDGIVYFKKDEKGTKKEPAQTKASSLNKEKKINPYENPNAKQDDGIIYFDIRDQVNENPDKPLSLADFVERGKASFYGDEFNGRRTASGELYDQNKFTAAHPKLKFGTKVRVTNLFNDLNVVVRINDRGPFVKGRIIDVSKAAAQKLDMIKAGVIEALLEIVEEE
jgi:rare lipoprotein A